MSENKYTPHPHAEVIKAWADGKDIQYWHEDLGGWVACQHPSWHVNSKYRVKPEEVVDYTVVFEGGTPGTAFCYSKEAMMERGWYFGYKIQGYLKRTRIDGKVVAMEFVPKE